MRYHIICYNFSNIVVHTVDVYMHMYMGYSLWQRFSTIMMLVVKQRLCLLCIETESTRDKFRMAANANGRVCLFLNVNVVYIFSVHFIRKWRHGVYICSLSILLANSVLSCISLYAYIYIGRRFTTTQLRIRRYYHRFFFLSCVCVTDCVHCLTMTTIRLVPMFWHNWLLFMIMLMWCQFAMVFFSTLRLWKFFH